VAVEALTGVPSGLVPLAKAAAVSLEKKGLTGQRAAVYLVVDRSYSMKDYYTSGTVQHLADQALGLSVNLDDDGTVPLVFFDSQPYPVVDISLNRYTGVVAQQHQLHGGTLTMGGTQYAIAMRTVLDHYQDYQAKGGTAPALVIFQTDGAPQDRDAARLALAQASALPVFWAFVGFGPHRIAFLEQLDDLPGRVVDNASYFHAGEQPAAVADSDLYDGITGEFGPWMTAARSRGVLR
jgi:hypothetical protein